QNWPASCVTDFTRCAKRRSARPKRFRTTAWCKASPSWSAWRRSLVERRPHKRACSQGTRNNVPAVKRLLCLANSRKLNGRCVAGIELSDNDQRIGWIRPVSAREHEEVSEYERQYEDGSDPMVLDVMNIPLLEARPKGYQQENWLLDPEHYWQK